jgi:TonB-dependent starch-binding outer membrane protein SusC
MKSLQDGLSLLNNYQDIKLKQMKKYFTLLLKTGFAILFFIPVSIFAQNITGVIHDEESLPLPGVTVLIEGTQTGATTDLDGKFSIGPVEPGTYTLEISYVGYEMIVLSVEVKENGSSKPVRVNMQISAQNLDELVVVGYGVQRKREVTGTISKIDAKEIMALPTQSFESALQGLASGVQVTTGSGLAGSASTIRIRGISSVSAGGDPLYVVDGIPINQDYFLRGNSGGMNNNPLATINPSDIKSIEILKDAAATGIYGSRGANGVILITTKRGVSKKLTFDFISRVGIAEPTALPNMVNSTEYLQLLQEAYENDGGTGFAPLLGGLSWEEAQQINTDWVNQTVGTGIKQLYGLSLNKKGDNWGIYGNFSYDNNQSYLIGNSYVRTSGRLNFDWAFAKKWKLAVNTSLSNGINNKVDNAWSGGLGAAMSTALPIYPIYWREDVYDIDGNTGDSVLIHQKGDYWLQGGVNNNPVASRNLKEWRTSELRTINNLQLTFNPTENWVISGNLNYEYMRLFEDQWESAEYIQNTSSGAGIAKRFPVWVNNISGQLLANYIKTFKEVHDVKLMAGTEYQYSQTKKFSKIEYTNIDGPLYEKTGDKQYETIIEAPLEQWAFSSVFLRGNYMYNKRYIVQLTGRVDGSSKFGPNNKFGFFPSASVGWIMSEENFMNSQRVISFLKWKVSYGRTGNANIPVYQYFSKYSPPENNNDYNGNPILFKLELENPNLKWETTNTFDGGVEIGLFKDRITVEASYYYKKSKDVLMNIQLPLHMGFGLFWDNVAVIMNRGWEFRVQSRNIVGRFEWSTDLNVARNYNEIQSIGPYREDAIIGGTNDTRVVLGQPVGTNFLVRYVGVDPENGKPIYLDIDGNQTYEWDPKDRVPVGKVLPDFIGGITNTFRWKQWDASLLVIFSVGSQIYNSSSKRQLSLITDWSMDRAVFDRWRQPGDNDVTYPRLTRETETYGSGTPWINTDLWLHKGDYLRFRNLTLGYTFKPWTTNNNNQIKLRIVGNITNFLTFTNYPGLDPEIARDFDNPADRNMSQNVTYLTPPQERTYNLSVYLTF